MVTITKPVYYSYYGVDLRLQTKFKQAVTHKRTSITHENLIELGFKRMPKAKFYLVAEEAVNEEVGMKLK
ncbi:MAG: hypothetical protein N3A69_00335 [Leptospiraceae bacterium]|nr:hypothetical protein [Leptospiraceae bacterium]